MTDSRNLASLVLSEELFARSGGCEATVNIQGGGSPMRLNRVKQDEREPIGIVIADGSRGDAVPKFAAFVWGPVPDEGDAPAIVRELAASL